MGLVWLMVFRESARYDAQLERRDAAYTPRVMSAASSHLDGLTSALHPSDSELFLRATGQPLHDLVSEIRNDEPLYHELFNDTGKSLLL